MQGPKRSKPLPSIWQIAPYREWNLTRSKLFHCNLKNREVHNIIWKRTRNSCTKIQITNQPREDQSPPPAQPSQVHSCWHNNGMTWGAFNTLNSSKPCKSTTTWILKSRRSTSWAHLNILDQEVEHQVLALKYRSTRYYRQPTKDVRRHNVKALCRDILKHIIKLNKPTRDMLSMSYAHNVASYKNN